jgi:hypothetical protein
MVIPEHFYTGTISVTDQSYDGIRVLSCTHKESEFEFVIFSCYLPPENSTRSRDSQGFFSHFLAHMYLHSDADCMLGSGDFNARIEALSDIIGDIDKTSQRVNLDQSMNGHGHDFIEFLNEAKLCTLNGRYDPKYDNFTSISDKGRSVVDYTCSTHNMLKFCKEVKVTPAQSVVDKYSLHGYLCQISRIPDHSLRVSS